MEVFTVAQILFVVVLLLHFYVLGVCESVLLSVKRYCVQCRRDRRHVPHQ